MSTLYAIATGSRVGLAHSAWPRSTGDNVNSFRELGTVDADGDGLTDEEEVARGSDPARADTDGDGYSDGVEVQYSSDPKESSSIPDIVEATVAIKVSFGTNKGHRYRLQSSSDLSSWADAGEVFEGTGTKGYQLVEAAGMSRYWRLFRAD